MSDFRLLTHAALVTALSLMCGCATAARPTADGAARQSAATDEDCFAVGDTKKRESCFSRKPDDEIAECERLRPSACKPYRDMHRLDQEVVALTRDLAARAQKKYASYRKGDAAYLSDLSAYLDASNQAWTASRDADCLLEPFVQGMSRRDAGDLTEACRVERTQARIAQVKELLSSLK
ncbi:uncharacterized protein YecT (DUF1311 family) [Lysobacter enzymogenes]|uniref:lysozyme inhibitor LprI family protein n=1 Tax=Lysobacter enzymogenes TaxID=69 RepID=UPI003398CC5A